MSDFFFLTVTVNAGYTSGVVQTNAQNLKDDQL